MRLVRFEHRGRVLSGLIEADGIRYVDATDYHAIELISELGWAGLESRATASVPISQVKIVAPIHRPRKIFGIGLNYRDHATEQGLEPPVEPILFPILPSAVIGPGEPIPLHPELTSKVDYEAELGVIIGKHTRDVTADTALDHVLGYTAINDISARDLQRGDAQWIRAKGLDGFTPVGPTIVSPDAIDPFDTVVQCLVNGELRQDSNTRNLLFDVPTLIAYCSRGMTLEPGDMIATGTPSGVGVYMDPPVFLSRGDEVTVRIEGIGDLVNPVGE